MNTEYIQLLLQKLQHRVNRLNSTDDQVFHFSLKHFWSFINSTPIFLDIFEDLTRRFPSLKKEAEKIIEKREAIVSNDDLSNTALSYYVIKLCAESANNLVEIRTGSIYSSENVDDPLKFFKSFFLRPLHEYLDEQLNEQRLMHVFLRRYKQKCEWFQRNYLFNLWERNTKSGEKKLALHFYEYLHDQGIDFILEPSSISGKVDLIAAQKSDHPLIADAKIFNPQKGKGKLYIMNGFNQIYSYTLDYNESFGYLIVYNTSGKEILSTILCKYDIAVN
jgi:hypothetical protein